MPIKIIIAILVLGFAWKTYQSNTQSASQSTAAVSYKTEDLKALASRTKAEDIIMYSTPDCTYCNQAKGWLNQTGFKFTDCDMTVSKQCEQQFHDYKGDGTPLLVVKVNGKEHLMKDGFDSDELIQILSGKS